MAKETPDTENKVVYKYVVECPHCGKQQTCELETYTGGETKCISCEKSFYIGFSGEELIHSHPDKAAADKFISSLKGDKPFIDHDCPACGKKLDVRNYGLEIGRTLCNHCLNIIMIITTASGETKISKYIYNSKSIFDISPEAQT